MKYQTNNDFESSENSSGCTTQRSCQESQCFSSKLKRLQKRMSQYRLIGILLSAFSGLAFTMSNFMVQVAHVEISQTSKDNVTISTYELVFIRCFVQLCFVTPFIYIMKIELYKHLSDIPYCLIMGVAGFTNIILIYCSLEKIPISDTLLVTFTSPFFCDLFSRLFLKESLHWINCLAGICSFIGVIVVARPSFIFGKYRDYRITLSDPKFTLRDNETVYLMGIAYAAFGAIFLALYFVLVRKLIKVNGLSAIMTIFYPSLLGAITTVLLILIFGEPVFIPRNANDFFICSSIGVYSIVALVLLTLALSLENATIVNLIRNLDVVYAFLLQYVIFNISPNLWNLTGGTIIIFATSIVVIKQYFTKRMVSDESGIGGDEAE
ncbi:solute carrier family 35 member G1-like [Clytia hemisphaerica]|uniref:solute carrier family 35 member G1-like n=1 Tax=Clytia hemisphaerica TaxID=252671 RepID=UPI0034D70C9C|eukprot:TCONS_00017142-protein